MEGRWVLTSASKIGTTGKINLLDLPNNKNIILQVVQASVGHSYTRADREPLAL